MMNNIQHPFWSFVVFLIIINHFTISEAILQIFLVKVQLLRRFKALSKIEPHRRDIFR